MIPLLFRMASHLLQCAFLAAVEKAVAAVVAAATWLMASLLSLPVKRFQLRSALVVDNLVIQVVPEELLLLARCFPLLVEQPVVAAPAVMVALEAEAMATALAVSVPMEAAVVAVVAKMAVMAAHMVEAVALVVVIQPTLQRMLAALLELVVRMVVGVVLAVQEVLVVVEAQEPIPQILTWILLGMVLLALEAAELLFPQIIITVEVEEAAVATAEAVAVAVPERDLVLAIMAASVEAAAVMAVEVVLLLVLILAEAAEEATAVMEGTVRKMVTLGHILVTEEAVAATVHKEMAALVPELVVLLLVAVVMAAWVATVFAS